MSVPLLSRLGASARARIVRVNSEFAVRERLAALGVKPGRLIRVVRRMGATGPLQVRIDHTDLVVRAAEAEKIEVEVMA
jgi:ferrous iron transport protein A